MKSVTLASDIIYFSPISPYLLKSTPKGAKFDFKLCKLRVPKPLFLVQTSFSPVFMSKQWSLIINGSFIDVKHLAITTSKKKKKHPPTTSACILGPDPVWILESTVTLLGVCVPSFKAKGLIRLYRTQKHLHKLVLPAHLAKPEAWT